MLTNRRRDGSLMAELVVALVLGILFGTTPASAQSRVGPFVEFDGPWLLGGSNVGFGLNGSQITVDRNGDGLVNDITYTLPAEVTGGSASFHLSPTREFLLVRGGDPIGGCGGTPLRIFSLPSTPGALPPPVHALCFAAGIDNTRYFFDTGILYTPTPPPQLGHSSQRIAYVLTSPSTGNPSITWFNLNVSGPAGRGTTQFSNGIGAITVSRSGTLALVQHDLADLNGDADYTLVDLCPGTLGTPINAGGFPIADYPNFLTAETSAVSNGQATIRALDGATPVATFQLVDCLVSAAPTGACCVDGNCTPAVVQSACAGTWAQGAPCTPNPCEPPATPELSLTMSGPASVRQGETFTYTLFYRNDGDAAAQGVEIADTIPSTVSFVAASDEGTFGFGNTVQWIIGTVPANSGQRSVTVTVRASCTATSASNSVYSLFSLNGGSVQGAPPVTTTITTLAASPVTVSLSSVPSSAPPLVSGDIVTHTVTITNTVATVRPNLTFGSNLNPGAGASFDQLVDAAGGTFTLTPFGTLDWTGTVGANSTVNIVFTTRINDCIDYQVNETRLQPPNGIMFIFDQCNRFLGQSSASPAFAVERPVSASLELTNVTPGVVGPPDGDDEIFIGTTYQPVRDGAPVITRITITNNFATPSNLNAVCPLPEGLIVADPPFVGTPGAGFGYESSLRMILFDGVVPGSGSVAAEFAATLAPGGECSEEVEFTGSTSGGCTDVSGTLSILRVPAMPPAPYLIAMDTYEGLLVLDFDVPAPEMRRLLCVGTETLQAMVRMPDGDVWTFGLPTFMFNPDTLEFRMLGNEFQALLGSGPGQTHIVTGAALDPADGTLILCGRGPNISTGIVWRFNPATDAVTRITEQNLFRYPNDVAIDPQQRVTVNSAMFGLNRVNLAGAPLPIPSGAAQPVPTPNFQYAPCAGLLGTPEAQLVAAMRGEAGGDIHLLLNRTYRLEENPPDPFPVTFHYLWTPALIAFPDDAGSITVPLFSAVAASSTPPDPPLNACAQPLVLHRFSTSTIATAADGTLYIASGQPAAVTRFDPAAGIATTLWSTDDPMLLAELVEVPGPVTPPCGSADFDGDGDTGTDADLEAFFACLGGSCCAGCGTADFNNDGDTGTDADIEAFFRVLAGGTC